MQIHSRHFPRSALWILVGGLLIGQAWMAFRAVETKSMTVDELAHLTGGLALWNGDYRLVPENGNLPQRLDALPAWLLGARLPAVGPDANVWLIGHQYLFKSPGIDHWPLLMAGRAMNLIFLTGVSLMVFLVARAWWGELAGIIALTAASFSPNLLAHGPLVTSDMAATLLLPLGAITCWWHLHRGTCWSRLILILVLGLACMAKFSAVLLVPVVLILDAIHLSWTCDRPRLHRVGQLIVDHVLVVCGVLLIIWSFHGWRFEPVDTSLLQTDHGYFTPWESVLGPEQGWRYKVLQTLRRFRVLPDAFIYGAGFTASSAQSRLSFLNGEVGTTGWPYFFPYAFAVKTPLSVLALALLGVGAVRNAWLNARDKCRLRIKRGLLRAAPLLTWTAVYGVVAINSHLNIGLRHILPLYPGLFVLCGASALFAGPLLRGTIAVLLGLLVFTSLRVHPHYLAYFNTLGGGPSQGRLHLVDSSLDWGQDLPALAEWLRDNADGEPVYLGYFGTSSPDYYHISPTWLPSLPPIGGDHHWSPLTGGIYAISATLLQEIYHGPWDAKREALYKKIRADPTIDPNTSLEFRDLLAALRMQRLCHVLRHRQPISQPGYSILIYRLSEDDARLIDLGSLPADVPAPTTDRP